MKVNELSAGSVIGEIAASGSQIRAEERRNHGVRSTKVTGFTSVAGFTSLTFSWFSWCSMVQHCLQVLGLANHRTATLTAQKAREPICVSCFTN